MKASLHPDKFRPHSRPKNMLFAGSLIFRVAALDASGQCLAIFVGTSGIGRWMEP